MHISFKQTKSLFKIVLKDLTMKKSKSLKECEL